MGINHVQGRVRCPATNGKVERFFRTFKLWLRVTLLPLNARGTQKRLDRYRYWYNEHRPHQALDGRTPEEAWSGQLPPAAVSYRARNRIEPVITIRRVSYCGDPDLPVIDIRVSRRITPAA